MGLTPQHTLTASFLGALGPKACLGTSRTSNATMQEGEQGVTPIHGPRQKSGRGQPSLRPGGTLFPGVRGPVFGEPLAPLHASGVSLGEGRGSEVDVSDLGSRNYSARTDFYCLVSEDDV